MNSNVSWWLKNGHSQTIMPVFLRTKKLPFIHDPHPTSDGDIVNLYWIGTGIGPIIILLPGMGGTYDASYIYHFSVVALSRGFRCLVLEPRGAIDANLLAQFYHASFITDIEWLVTKLHAEGNQILAVGFSLGASMLVRWMAEAGNKSCLIATAMVSMVFDLHATAQIANRGINRLYQARVLSDFMRVVRQKTHMKEYQNIESYFDNIKSMKDFDEIITAPINGFKSAFNYYSKSSSNQFLPLISIPSLLLNAADDPLICPTTWPKHTALPNNLCLVKPEYGGHLGFLSNYKKSHFPELICSFFEKELKL